MEWQQKLLSQATEQAKSRAEPLELTVEYPGTTPGTFAFRGVIGASTSIDVLKQMHEMGLPKFQALAAKSRGEVLDLRAPLQQSGSLQLLEYETVEKS